MPSPQHASHASGRAAQTCPGQIGPRKAGPRQVRGPPPNWAARLTVAAVLALVVPSAAAMDGFILGGTQNCIPNGGIGGCTVGTLSQDSLVGAGRTNRVECFGRAGIVAGQRDRLAAGACAPITVKGPPPPPGPIGWVTDPNGYPNEVPTNWPTAPLVGDITATGQPTCHAGTSGATCRPIFTGPCGNATKYLANLNAPPPPPPPAVPPNPPVPYPTGFMTCFSLSAPAKNADDAIAGAGADNVDLRADSSGLAGGRGNRIIYQDFDYPWWVPPCTPVVGQPQTQQPIAGGVDGLGTVRCGKSLTVHRTADAATILGGTNNVVTAAASGLGAGTGNVLDSLHRIRDDALVGGQGNYVGEFVPSGQPTWLDPPLGPPQPAKNGFAIRAVLGAGQQNGLAGNDVFLGAGVANGAVWNNVSILGGRMNNAGDANTPVGKSAFVGAGFCNSGRPACAPDNFFQNGGALGDRGGLGAGSYNFASGDAAVVSGVRNAASVAFVGGGEGNAATGGIGNGGATGGGIGNVEASFANAVGGGSFNRASRGAVNQANFPGPGNSAVLGGASNRAIGTNGFVGGGVQGNQAANESSGVMGGSSGIAEGFFAAILGGNEDHAFGRSAAILGGNTSRAGYFAVVLGGHLQNAPGAGAFIGGGARNVVEAGAGTKLMAGLATVNGGFGNVAAGRMGDIPGGREARSHLAGQVAYASGDFTQPGDAQSGHVLLRAYAPSGGITPFTLDGGQALVVPDNTTWAFEGIVVARDAFGMSHGWTLKGAVKREHNVMQFVNAAVVVKDVSFDQNAATWRLSATLDAANHALRLNAYSPAPVRFVADLEMAQVGAPR